MNEILKQLELISGRGYSCQSIFSDFIDLMLYALQQDGPPYLEIVKKYKNNLPIGHREIDFFQLAFSLLLSEMQVTNDEILGQLYMQWNLSNKYKGQFFTPKQVAQFMALAMNPQGKIIDPCSGSGILLVECIKTMNNGQLDTSIFFGQDIDLMCTKMTALNLCFFNVNGYVVHGDTLKVECNKVYQTSRSYLGGNVIELTGKEFEDFKSWYAPMVERTLTENPEKFIESQDPLQLALF